MPRIKREERRGRCPGGGEKALTLEKILAILESMKNRFLTTVLSLSCLLGVKVYAYDNPPSLCYEGCTPWMLKLEQDYNRGGALPLDPRVYSGSCHIIGNYNPETEHHAVMMIDHRAVAPYFSVILSFFAGQNDFIHWNLDQARKEMSSYWKQHGHLLFAEPTLRVEIPYEDGSGPAFTYWMRYNSSSREAYLITYMGIYTKILCRLNAHDQ